MAANDSDSRLGLTPRSPTNTISQTPDDSVFRVRAQASLKFCPRSLAATIYIDESMSQNAWEWAFLGQWHLDRGSWSWRYSTCVYTDRHGLLVGHFFCRQVPRILSGGMKLIYSYS